MGSRLHIFITMVAAVGVGARTDRLAGSILFGMKANCARITAKAAQNGCATSNQHQRERWKHEEASRPKWITVDFPAYCCANEQQI